VISGILQQLRTVLVKKQVPRHTLANYSWLKMVLVTSVGVTALVWGVREGKWLQSLELKVYDQMLRSTSDAQTVDHRILIVTITQQDLEREKWPLSDDTINQLLAKLASYQPRVIGLNIYRPGQKNLAAGLKNREQIISLCLISSMGNSEIPPPPNFPIYNVGYNDLIPDAENGQILRRALLFAYSSDKKCQTQFSFAALLGIKYLEKQGFAVDFPDQTYFSIGKTIFPIITRNFGSYQGINAQGYQVLLNYRNPNYLAQTVTLTQVLNNQINPDLVKDKLIIIGTTAPSVHPGFYTPFSASPQHSTRTAGVFIHAQIASQIISTVLDGKPLFWDWPNWVELLWVWGWSVVGGVLVWRLQHPGILLIGASVTLIGLIGICFSVFLFAGWIPLIPSAFSLVIAGVSMRIYTTYKTQQQMKMIVLQVEQQKEVIEQLDILLKETTADTATIRDSRFDIVEHEAAAKGTGDFLLKGRYQVSQVLGSGGFGCTYLAKDTQRPGYPICVVKQLMPARRDTRFLQVARRLFHTEAEILQALGKHQQIPELLAYFVEQQEFYLIEEYIAGHTLSEELPPVQGLKSELYVINLLQEMLGILAFVHEHRVIHRDIKPTNIIRCAEDNRLVLIDFGAVKLMQPANSEETELATVAIGTRGYAPPEQFVGHPRLCSDIYALGMIAIQALTGVLPQELQPDPKTGNIMWRSRAQVSAELATIVDKMVRYNFSDRYQSVAAVLQDLTLMAIAK
jgi:CHASE2 domain-containing sensor protein/predicted Ser/Thr protein kinase